MTKKVMPEGCCRCHNISIYSCSAVMAQPSGNCRLFLDNSSSDLMEHSKVNITEEPSKKWRNECFAPLSCKGITPMYQIHKNSIHISNTTQLRAHMIGPREVEITCLECGSLLHVYASKKGAFCQIKEAKPVIICGSYPSETLLGCLCFSSLPKSMRSLFKKEDENIYNYEDYNSDDLYENLNPLSGDGDIDDSFSQNAFHNHENLTNSFNLLDGEENEDFDLMFSSQMEPVVGSYAELGLFLKHSNQIVI